MLATLLISATLSKAVNFFKNETRQLYCDIIYHKSYPFKVSVVFCIFIEFCNHHYCLTVRHFHSPQKEAPDPLAVIPHFPCLLTLETTDLTFCSYEFVSSGHSYEWNHTICNICV